MRNRLRLLDLFCCEGGAAVGYTRAGWEVVGVDLFEDYTQKRYPYRSLKGDAFTIGQILLDGGGFDAIHASPPCQHASAGTRALRAQGTHVYDALVEKTRDMLVASGLPYVIENVRGATLLDPTWLCGCMWDMGATDTDGIWLNLQRTRGFETNWTLEAPRPCDHSKHEWVGGSYGGARRDKYEAKYVRHGGYVPSLAVQQELLGIDWMTQKGMHQALPPRYTEWIGGRLMVQCH